MSNKKLTTKQFIQKAKEVHGDTYDYSKTEYINRPSKVLIICPSHGEFYQIAGDHLSGKKCNKCSRGIISESEFLNKARSFHNSKYDYSKVEYKNKNTKVKIICPEHGLFEQIAGNHLKCGCPKCSKTYPMTTQSFIQKAREVHGDLYDYSKTVYNKKQKVIITCKTHGDFEQIPNNHLRNHGCPSCSNMRSKMEIEWLKSLDNKNIKHHVSLKMKTGKSFVVDGYDPTTNTVYEFWGDFWHGNPATTNHNKINPRTKKTFGEHYTQTIDKINIINESGYNLVDIWENDFIKSLGHVDTQ